MRRRDNQLGLAVAGCDAGATGGFASLAISPGAAALILYHARAKSPTYEMINERYVSVHNRGFVRIPRGVYLAIENFGETDVVFINLPTSLYDEEAIREKNGALDATQRYATSREDGSNVRDE